MKKLFILLICLLFPTTVSALEPHDLVFEPDTSGKFIYCNNHEFIRRSDLADYSNEKAKFIMNNEHLTADKYAMFISHINHTEKRKADNSISEAGFDIEVDAAFIASEDTIIRIDAVGFEVPENKQYYYNGKSYTYEDEWGCFNTWASYLQLPIRQIDSGQRYDPVAFTPVEFELKAGETRWLSEFIPNYSVDPWYRPIHIMADFEILSGECDVNVAALKSTGTLGDRSNFNPKSDFGSYERDRQYKGIADSLNIVNANLSYTIDDDVWSGTALPVKVYNQSVPEGNEITKWYTHLNPRADQWSNKICTESDMLAFNYYDPMKKVYYGSEAEDKDDYWHFDTKHSDTAAYQKDYGDSYTYVPNRVLEGIGVDPTSCNLGNYGVILNYDIDITNNGNLIRYVNYQLSTSSNNVVILRDENGNVYNNYALCKGKRDARVMDNMACLELPAHKTTKFSLQVILTTNYAGGMENALYITDTPNIVEVYESERQEISKVYKHTGKEFYKWENARLCVSDDLKHWRTVKLDDRINEAIKGNWNEFELLYTGDGYMLKPCIYDGIPYYTVQNFFRTVYFLDSRFNYVSEHEFGYYPSDFAAAKGVYYVKSATPYSSKDRKTWDYWNSPLPCYNYGRFAAMTSESGIKLSADGETFNSVVFDDITPSYIDTVGNLYYFADGKTLYLSHDGIYWTSHEMKEKVKSLYKAENEVIVNNSETVKVPKDNNSLAVKVNDEYIGFSKPPVVENGVTLIPARFISEYLGADVNYDNGKITVSKDNISITLTSGSAKAYSGGKEYTLGAKVKIIDDRSYVPMRFLAEQFGMNVDWDKDLNLALITNEAN